MATIMIENASSPRRRAQATVPQQFPFKKPYGREGFGSLSVLLERHRFLLTTLTLLFFLCTVYLYFAVTLGSDGSCSGITGSEKDRCLSKLLSSHSIDKGKLKFF
ncbi:hypothetical protein ZOSMA_45G00090 [Zostera marina]|uniref:Uncharacterized protein n=1 Tax=Zostera marina TaxID=29655 RepID=A0A0K9P076_ZOSMR|nr:hypothetical protein ZOSMA_45G00090 [Zostera marina]